MESNEKGKVRLNDLAGKRAAKKRFISGILKNISGQWWHTHPPPSASAPPTGWQKFPFSDPAEWSRSLIYFLWFLFLDELVLIFFLKQKIPPSGPQILGNQIFQKYIFFLTLKFHQLSEPVLWKKIWKNFRRWIWEISAKTLPPD